ncbi:MAG TPA: hypothetical protein VMF69_23940 [Gemmataceae bacterium]|nr:hypothetical protein [Gemmataceae bacterium]
MSERSEDRELTSLASALRELRPMPDAMDRAVLMYRAGRASARRGVWVTTTLFSSAVAVVLGITLWVRPAPPVVYVAVPPDPNASVSAAPPPPLPASAPERGAWARYIHLQEQVLLHGLDGLPASPSNTEEPSPDVESLWKSL